MTVRELVELNQMITDIEIIVRVNGSALLDAIFIGPAVGEKPRYPLNVPKEQRYVGNMSIEYRKEAKYIAKSINAWDDGKDYWQVKPSRIPKGWGDLEVYSWEVWPASTVCYTSPRRQTGIDTKSRNVNFHGQRINIVALPSGEKLPDPEECKAKTDDQEQLKGQMSLEEFYEGGMIMTNAEIVKRFRATIDQYYAYPWNHDKDYREQHQQIYIGGILQAALHIIPWDDYYGLKTYIWEKHGYDPGGVTTGQMTIEELMEG